MWPIRLGQKCLPDPQQQQPFMKKEIIRLSALNLKLIGFI